MNSYRMEHTEKLLYNVHAMNRCFGPPCPIHYLTAHHMRSFPQHWRSDRKIMERICPHGVGHPDPDDPSAASVHGCCWEQCCTPPEDRRPESQDGWCAFHNETEEIRDGDVVCGECWHRFRGEEDVVAVNNANWHEERTFDQIFSCPFCTHDF